MLRLNFLFATHVFTRQRIFRCVHVKSLLKYPFSVKNTASKMDFTTLFKNWICTTIFSSWFMYIFFYIFIYSRITQTHHAQIYSKRIIIYNPIFESSVAEWFANKKIILLDNIFTFHCMKHFPPFFGHFKDH